MKKEKKKGKRGNTVTQSEKRRKMAIKMFNC